MQTNFSLAQLADPDIAVANDILRSCVHCGFCTATCPTYVLLGDELDSPRGRIYLIKEMLEGDRPATEKVAKHIDRCLSCLSCMTTCPSGVHYMHLVDHARSHIEKTYRRPFLDRAMRTLLANLLPYPNRFRLALIGAWLARPLRNILPGRLGAMLALAPKAIPSPSPVDRPQVFPAQGPRRKRVALLSGCAQPVLAPGINEATVRLLTRHGCEVVVAAGASCCGALTHHMGREDSAHALAKSTIAAWTREIEGEGLDAIIINASGCGTTVKDYGFMFREDAGWADKAARVSALTKDVTELMEELGLASPSVETGQIVAYHSACSMQHGQKIKTLPQALLTQAGFTVKEVPEGHICCGSAGTYNMLQPEIATRLRDRKLANIGKTQPDIIAAGNLGCMTQIGSATDIPILHTVELLDWATGGPKPQALERG
ncbi:MAG: glycolate oxidase subunit GlcF [Oceanibaculum nanhaiense]|uniref:glycolate oxidase subunit GlcF n=1 Tax=Oceanibaculum nanhaiense TaxID=1909734 RepID=UPI0025A33479|nr:glycolate oxidase subunit GlcF [Oceanibaculum nanhaiense]MDM7945522.1 glycolate oxidase subunit GlcF [Oceanibaculum nanhaiense]